MHGIQFGVTFFIRRLFLSSAGEIFQKTFHIDWNVRRTDHTNEKKKKKRRKKRHKHTYTSYTSNKLASANSVVELMSIWFTLRVQHAGKMFCLPCLTGRLGRQKSWQAVKENFKWFSRVSALLANVVEVFSQGIKQNVNFWIASFVAGKK